ncbi:MAG: histidine phosphatase family protein [Burkholderiales bacterium]|nr:MAG: histidine phosphatase family protein [Burkholderiales bacterium]
MNLLLWRHAQAEDGMPDLERALTARGRRQAEQMARWLEQNLPASSLILASPARRAIQTVDALGRDYTIDERLAPERGVTDCLAAARWPEGPGHGVDTVLAVGHQPTLGATAAFLLAGLRASWSVKKGAVWWLVGRERDGAFQVTLRCVLDAALI